MAKTNTAPSAVKANFFVRVGRWFKALPKKIGKSFKDMWSELKKVTWPSKQELINYSLVVFAFMIVMAIIIGLFDAGSGALVRLITKAGA